MCPQLSRLEQLPYELLSAIIALLPSLEDVLPLACSPILRRHIYSTLVTTRGNIDELFRYSVERGDTFLLRATLTIRPGNVNRYVLRYAASWGHVKILAVLLCQPSSGPLLSELSGGLCTKMLKIACRKRQLAMMHRLLALHERTQEGRYLGDVAQPLDEEGQGWSREMIGRLIRAGVDMDTAEAVVPPVIVGAVRQQNVANIEQLLDLGAGRNSSEADWNTLFSPYSNFACSKRVLRLLFARVPVLRANSRVWELILRTGCYELTHYCLSFNLDLASNRFWTINCSFLTQWPDISEALQWTKILYERGACMALQAPLLAAVKIGDLESSKYFLDAYGRSENPNFFLPNLLGYSQHSHVTRYLLESGIDPKIAESDLSKIHYVGGTPVGLLLSNKRRLYARHEHEEEMMKCLELLICYGADISLTSADGESALRKALRWLEREDLIPFFKERGAK